MRLILSTADPFFKLLFSDPMQSGVFPIVCTGRTIATPPASCRCSVRSPTSLRQSSDNPPTSPAGVTDLPGFPTQSASLSALSWEPRQGLSGSRLYNAFASVPRQPEPEIQVQCSVRRLRIIRDAPLPERLPARCAPVIPRGARWKNEDPRNRRCRSAGARRSSAIARPRAAT